jgi:Phosphatidylinositol-specific phospholipase C, Y domain
MKRRSDHTKKSKIIRRLSDLGIYTTATHFNPAEGFQGAMSRLYNHIHSFSESFMEEFVENSSRAAGLILHCRDYLLRVYPRGGRVSSSNQKPAVAWRHGAQFVAMNWQTFDMPMMLNHAMFYGSDGYVLKPAYIHGSDPSVKTLDLTIEVVLWRNEIIIVAHRSLWITLSRRCYADSICENQATCGQEPDL